MMNGLLGKIYLRRNIEKKIAITIITEIASDTVTVLFSILDFLFINGMVSDSTPFVYRSSYKYQLLMIGHLSLHIVD